MTILTVFLTAVVATSLRIPLLDLYNQAEALVEDGGYEESAALFNDILSRMPDNSRAVYNHAVSFLAAGDVHTADSLLSILPDGVFLEDTLLEARSSAKLGNAIASKDYAGVQSVVEMLLPAVSGGQSSQGIRQNYEVALKWLSQNEPPPPEDNQDQSDDSSDQNEDQSDDNQDQSDDNSDQNEDQSDDNQDQSDDNSNQDENQSDSEEDDQPPPPARPEMTPEVAQMILDMVEEAQADSTDGTINGAIGVPNW
jgi:Mg-chelatase subunit ChlI